MATSYTLSVPGQLFVFGAINNMCMTPWDKIDAELGRQRIAWSTLATHLDATKQSANHWKRRGVPSKYFRAIEQFLQKPLGWAELDIDGVRSEPELINLDNNPDYPAIRKVNFKLSAGASGFGVDYDGEDHSPIVFGKYWYEVNKFRPEALFAVRVTNASMEPTLYSGDIVVVNTLSTTPKDGCAFAIDYEGETVVKRVVRDEGEWWMQSDNADQVRYKRKRMHEGCQIIGEIVHRQSMRI